MVGIAKPFCEHVLEHAVINIDTDGAVIEFCAVEPEYVLRSGRIPIVTGWFTWLAMDMAASLVLNHNNLNALTVRTEVDFIKPYRSTNIICHVEILDKSSDTWQIKINVHSGNLLVASAVFYMKTLKGPERNEGQR